MCVSPGMGWGTDLSQFLSGSLAGTKTFVNQV